MKNQPKLSKMEKFNLNENFLKTLNEWADDQFLSIETDYQLFVQKMPKYLR